MEDGKHVRITSEQRLQCIVDRVPDGQKITELNINPGRDVHPWMCVFGIRKKDAATWACYACQGSGKDLKHSGNTTNLRNHFQRAHRSLHSAVGFNVAKGADSESKKLFFDLIVGKGLPFSFAEDPMFLDFMKAETKNRNYKPPMSRRSLARSLDTEFDTLYTSIKGEIASLVSRGRNVSISVDVWTRVKSYFAVAVHFIDPASWSRRTYTLDVAFIEKGKTAAELVEYLDNVLANYGIPHNRIEALTTDGAGDVASMGANLGPNGTPWYYCACHKFNRSIVRAFGGWASDANPPAKEFLESVIDFSHAYRHGYCIAALEHVQQAYWRKNPRTAADGSRRTRVLRLPNACTTRWTSVYRLLERLKLLEPVLASAETAAREIWEARKRKAKRPLPPPNKDLVNLYCALLAPVNSAIVEMQGSGFSIAGYSVRIQAAVMEVRDARDALRAAADGAGNTADRVNVIINSQDIQAAAVSCGIVAQSAAAICRHMDFELLGGVEQEKQQAAAQWVDPRYSDLLDADDASRAVGYFGARVRIELEKAAAAVAEAASTKAVQAAGVQADPELYSKLSAVEKLRLKKTTAAAAAAAPAAGAPPGPGSNAIDERLSRELAGIGKALAGASTNADPLKFWLALVPAFPAAAAVALDLFSEGQTISL